jgi:hypothetical protein
MTQNGAAFIDGEGLYLSDRWRMTRWPANPKERAALHSKVIAFGSLTSGSLDAYLDRLRTLTPYSDGPCVTDLCAAIAYDICQQRAAAAANPAEVMRLNAAERDFRKCSPVQFGKEIWRIEPGESLPKKLRWIRPKRMAAVLRVLDKEPPTSARSPRATERQHVVMPILAKKTLLTKIKWTRNRLATKAGVSPSCVNEYLAGKRRLTDDNRQAIAEVLGLKPEQLPN